MVAYLHDGGVDDERLGAKSAERPKVGCLPPSHEAALKWYYKDPQGEIQGENQQCKMAYSPFKASFSIKGYNKLIQVSCMIAKAECAIDAWQIKGNNDVPSAVDNILLLWLGSTYPLTRKGHCKLK